MTGTSLAAVACTLHNMLHVKAIRSLVFNFIFTFKCDFHQHVLFHTRYICRLQHDSSSRQCLISTE